MLQSKVSNQSVDHVIHNHKLSVTQTNNLILYGLEDPLSLFLNPDILNASHIKLVLRACDQEKLKILSTLCKLNNNVCIELFSNQFQITFSELPQNIKSVSTLNFFNPLSESNATWKEFNTAPDKYNFDKTLQKSTMFSPKTLYLNDTTSKFFHLLVQGLSYEEISEQINMSINSVRYYIKILYKELGVKNKASVILMYQNGDIIVHNDPKRRVKNLGL